MSDLRTAAQQALKILELEGWGYPSPKTAEAITALKAALVEDAMQKFTDVNQELEAALAEPVQEPVAWMVYTLDGKSVCVTDSPADFTDEHRVLPLYTAPPLTEECLNCVSLQDQNTELDRKLAELQDAILRGNGIS